MAFGMARRVDPGRRCARLMTMMMHAPRHSTSIPPSPSPQHAPQAVARGIGELAGWPFSKLPMSFLMNRGRETALSLLDSNFYQLARFSALPSPHVDKKDPSTDKHGSIEEMMKPSATSQSSAAPVEEKLGMADVNDKDEGKPEVKSESDDEVNQEEEDTLGLLEEKDFLLEQKKKVITDLQDKLLRSLAEAENISNRAKREAESIKKYAIQNFAKDLLDVADNLGRAAATVPESIRFGDSSNDSTSILKTLLEGVEMTEKQLMQVFKKHGVGKFDPTDQPFNPNQHLALFEVQDASKTPGTVVTVLKSGYMLHDRVIRPAEVGVVKQEIKAGAEQES